MIDRCAPASHLWISVPAYTHSVHPHAARSLAFAVAALTQAGITVSMDAICGSAYLDHTRNIMCRRFMQSDATDILMIDSDVEFLAEAVLAIAKAERPFVGGTYPAKTEHLQFHATYLDKTAMGADGLVEVKMVPTGFLRLNRLVLDAMDKGPYHVGDDSETYRRYFETGYRMTDSRTKDGKRERVAQFWGEDTNLCREWRAKGGKVYLLPDITFRHWGMNSWTGNWAETHLKKAGQ